MTLSLVPVPVSVRVIDAKPFRFGADVAIRGDRGGATVLRDLLISRLGVPAVSAVPAGARPGFELQVIPGGPPESYRIAVDEASVLITAADEAGLFYGVQTVVQLVGSDDGGWWSPAVQIEDAPRFAYRGVMLDVARHFMPVDVVTAYIDRAASLKLNALHLHLSDDQGWRLELRSRPRLTAVGSSTSVAGDAGGFYTREDYRAIVAHAASRHMIVVPEFDVPGHTHAVGLAYPELVEAPVISDGLQADGGALPTPGVPYTGIGVGFSSLKIGDDEVYAFLADVFGELAALTPGPYLHIGGDECLGISPEDFAAFVARASEVVSDLGKTPIAWHEAGAAPGLAPGTIGQYWGFACPTDAMVDAARAFARAGAKLILSPADAVYLDMKPDAASTLGLTWANGPTSVARAYDWDPASLVDGVAESDVLGVEAPLWTETIRTLADIDAMAFPRIAAVAEIAWSPSPSASVSRTWESFRVRVGGLGPLWTALGIGFGASSEIPWKRA